MGAVGGIRTGGEVAEVEGDTRDTLRGSLDCFDGEKGSVARGELGTITTGFPVTPPHTLEDLWTGACGFTGAK